MPKEYFNPSGRRRYDDPDYPAAPQAQLDYLLRHSTGPNGVYALKTFYGQSEKVRRQVDWTRSLPHLQFVMLTRDDLLGQAISLVMSRQTGRYRSTDPASTQPVFDPKHIRRCVDHIADENRNWGVFFARRGIVPLYLRYERMIENLPATVASIGALAGVSIPPDPDWKPGLSVQRSGMNAEWRDRYLAWEDEPRPFWARRRT